MKENKYLPEGALISSDTNSYYLSSVKMLEKAMTDNIILEARAISCSAENLDLTVDLGCAVGIIPKQLAAMTDNGENPRDIAVITRVGRPICFTVESIRDDGGKKTAILSRKRAQQMCQREKISRLVPGDITSAAVTHLEPFGAFVDIGCGIVSLMSVDCISVSRISHPKDRLSKGDFIKAVVKSVDPETGRVYMTLREMLGTWEENAAKFDIGSTVVGKIRSIEDYGIFVELSPNLAGLAERREGIALGDCCAVYIKNMIKERMKVKLSIIDSYAADPPKTPLKYFIDTENTKHLSYWRYSPEGCPKIIESVFD